MKNVIKISISSLAFTLEEDGYVLLDKYLSQLKKYYAKQQNGMEVVEGIEERIAELLRERMSTPEEVVSKELVVEVMAIMGKPEDIEGEDTNANASAHTHEPYRGAAGDSKAKRRLYRNVDERVLGGVCSGMGAYFNLEPLLFRLIFVVLALFSSFSFFRHLYFFPFNVSIGGWVILTYIILWIVIPAAKSVAQKCEMRGERPDFSGIQDRVKRGAERVERNIRSAGQQISRNIEGSDVAKGIGRVIAFCVGIVLLLIAIPVLIALPVSMIFSASWLYGILPHGLTSIVAFNGNLFWIKILTACVVLLPFVGMLYGGIALIFNLKTPRVRPGLTIFIAWLVSMIALVIMLAFASRPYYGGVEEAREEISVPMHSDTLFVSYASSAPFPAIYLWMDTDASEASMAWLEGERHNLRAVVYPQIKIVRVGAEEQMHIRFLGSASGRYVDEAYSRAEQSIPAYTIQDSLLTLLPDVYSRNNQWQGNMGKVSIYLPKGKEVVLTSPYRHHFDRNAPRISKGSLREYHYIGHKRSNWEDRMERKWERWERKWDRWENRRRD